jgi:hypothetical protein
MDSKCAVERGVVVVEGVGCLYLSGAGEEIVDVTGLFIVSDFG